MVENREALAQVPAPSLVELARRATSGEVSPRRHAASRSRVLDHAHTSRISRPPAWAVAAVLGTAGFGAVGMTTAMITARRPTHDAAPAVATAPIPTVGPLLTVSPVSTNGKTIYVNEDSESNGVSASMKIEVSPPTAQIFWDNEKLDGNPVTLTRAPDGKTHHIRAEAPGFLPKRQMVLFDAKNVSIGLELQPSPAEIGPITVSGSIRNADPVIEGLRDRFRDCYAEGLAGPPGKPALGAENVTGSAVLLLTVSETGTVTSSDIVEKSGLPAKTTTCFAYVGADAEFVASGKPGTVRIPIAFHGAK